MTKDELAEAIAEIQVNSDRGTKMEEYLAKLEALSKEDRGNISGIFSDDGRSMTKKFASSLMTGMDENGEGGEINQEAMLA
jgi:S-adenosylhomocysteine hydrolase